jgi:uncharacterized protein with ParB-like and HNH nuclease domain
MNEDMSGIFKPEAKTIMKIFGDADSYYQIPDYQRPYSWEDEQIEQLWDDIYSAVESSDESYFLGPMILVRTTKGHFEVVDGQQRLTTLTILFCVLRDLYLKDDKRVLNAIKSLIDEKYRLRLITQLYYQNQFEQEILNRVSFPQTKLTKKQRDENKFINTALIFKEKLEEVDGNGGIDAIKKLTHYLLSNVVMITITCSKQEYAIKLFQVLNTRGLDLNHADLIKSYLYGKLEEETTKQQFISTWSEVETISKQIEESVTGLFTYYEYNLLSRNPKRTLYEELKGQFKGQDPNSIIYDFKGFVDFFNEIGNTQSKLIYSFYYIPNQVFWKAILTTAKKEKFSDFDELCKELRKVYYSYWIAGYTTSKIKQLSFNLIGWVKDEKTLREIKEEINRKMQEDTVFRRMKENLENEVYGNSWLRPLLILIEYKQTDDSKIVRIEPDRNLHVDHILPQGWREIDYWQKNWTDEQGKHWLNKIGNLTLLSGRKNSQASNSPLEKKKEIYKGKGYDGTTAFEISKKIIDKADWTENEVKERQEWMLEQIQNVLEINFSGDTAHAYNIA